MNLVFDFGNVLFEWNPRQLIADHFPNAATLQRDYLELANAMTDHDDWRDFDAGRLSQLQVCERTATRLSLDPQSVATFIDAVPHRVAPIAPNVEIVKRLCADPSGSHRVFFLSNMPVEFADVLESKYPWIGGFDGGIFSGRVGLIKPDPAIFLEAERRFALRPEETLFFDDVTGIVEAARRFGWRSEQIVDTRGIEEALEKHGVVP